MDNPEYRTFSSGYIGVHRGTSGYTCDIWCIYRFPANSVVSVCYSGPPWWVRQQRCIDSLVNIERQALGAPYGSRVLLRHSLWAILEGNGSKSVVK